MANEIDNGVFLNPITGNVIASGSIQANKVVVPSDTNVLIGETNLKNYVKENGGKITKIVAGENVTISPASGTGEVTINASGGGGGGGLVGHKLTVNLVTGGGAAECIFAIQKSDGVIRCGTFADWFPKTGYNFNISRNQIICDDVIAYSHCYGFSAERMGITFNDLPSFLNFIPITEDTTITHEIECLLRGTLISLADGTQKKIEDITYDDELLVWDFENNCYSHSKPAWIKMQETTDYYFVNKYASGKELLTTGKSDTGWGHRHYDITRKEFRYTPTTVSDKIFTLDGEDEHMSCQKVYGECEFYNIITEKHYNCFANGILTSCSLSNYKKNSGSISLNAFISCAKCFDKNANEEILTRYFKSLDIEHMPIDNINDLSKYTLNLISKEK